MRYIRLDNTQLDVSAIALGTAPFGSAVDDKQSFDIMSRFTENGGNVIDTAIMYGDWTVGKGESGISEKTIGKWMREKNNRHSVVISTKGAHPFYKTMDIPRLCAEDIKSDCEKSLKNLKTDFIDIYFLHRDDINRPVEEIMDTLNQLIKLGKIRYAGLSNWSTKRIEEALEYCEKNGLHKPIASQIQFSVGVPNADKIDATTRFMDKESFDYYKNHELNVFAFSAQACGYYFGLENKKEPNIQYDNFINRELYQQMIMLGERYGCSISNIMIGALCNNRFFKTVPIIGAKSTAHLDEAMQGADVFLEDSDVADLILKR